MRLTTKWTASHLHLQRHDPEGRPGSAINLAQGFPDFDGPDVIKDAAIAAIQGGLNQYAPSVGLPELRQLLGERQTQATGLTYDPATEITVFSGATEAIFCAMQALLEAGDEIIAFEPFYDSYPAAAHAAGAKLVGVPLTLPNGTLTRGITPRRNPKNTSDHRQFSAQPHRPRPRLDELQAIRDLRSTTTCCHNRRGI